MGVLLIFFFLSSAFGLNTPIYFMAYHMERDGLGEQVLLLQMYLGMGWVLGCVCFGLLVVSRKLKTVQGSFTSDSHLINSRKCRVSHRQTIPLPDVGNYVWDLHDLLHYHPGTEESARVHFIRVDLRDLLRWLPLLPENVHVREGAGSELCPHLGLCSVRPVCADCSGNSTGGLHEFERDRERGILL